MWKKIIIVFITLLTKQGLFGQLDGKILLGQEFYIKSEVLDENRSYIVGLPESYGETDNHYPVIYMTDGDYRFTYTSGIVEFLSKGSEIPESIVVGITNTNRTRDLTPTYSDYDTASGGGMKFLKFIVEELIPEIDNSYRTNGFRILAGHSYGGLFSGYAYINNSPFDAFIASDPAFAWDNQWLASFTTPENVAMVKNKKFYLTNADNYERNPDVFEFMRPAVEYYYALLKNMGSNQENIRLDYLPEENHGTCAYMSWYLGIRFVYNGFTMKNVEELTIKDIVDHYSQLTDKTGKTFLPPEQLVRNIAQKRKEKGVQEEVLELMHLNVKNYPSKRTYKALGDAYVDIGQEKRASKFYKKALEFDSKGTGVNKGNKLNQINN